jgi:hypothetical protein
MKLYTNTFLKYFYTSFWFDLIVIFRRYFCPQYRMKVCFTYICNKNIIFMTYRRAWYSSNTAGATSGAGTAYPSETPTFTSVFECDFCCLIVSFLGTVMSTIVCSFGHCSVCRSSNYKFWFSLWYLQPFLEIVHI